MGADRLQLAEISIDPSANQLIGRSDSVSIEPRAMQVLLYLLQRRGEVVSRRDLFEHVWRSAQVTDDTLNRMIFDLRKAFRTLQPGLEPIETIRRVGYRVIDYPTAAPRNRRPMQAIPLLLGAAALLFGGLQLEITRDAPTFDRLDVQPFSVQQGFDTYPAMHPNDNQVLFTCSSDGGVTISLCVQDLNSLTSRILLPAGGEGAAVHPDGKRVAYQFIGGSSCEIRVFNIEDRSGSVLTQCNQRNDGSLAWSADGQHLFFSDTRAPNTGSFEIRSVSVDGGPISTVTRPPAGSIGDLFPTPAPDGRTLAFFRADRETTLSTYITPGIGRVYLAPLDGGLPDQNRLVKALEVESSEVTGLAWVGNGSQAELVFFSNAKGTSYSLWRLPRGDQPSVAYRDFPGIVRKPTVSANGTAIAELWTADADIYSLSLLPEADPAEPVFSSSRYDFNPASSPDGRLMAWVSTRSGRPLLWIGSMADGRAMFTVDLPPGFAAESPQWSPDSQQIAFEVRGQGGSRIAIHALQSSSTDWLDLQGNSRAPSWSLDGESLLFASDRSGDWEVWRYSLSDATSAQVTLGGAYAQREYRTEVDTGLIFSRRDQAGLWKQSFDSGETEQIVMDLPLEHWGNWTVQGEDIYFAVNEQRSALVIAVNIDTRKRRRVSKSDRRVLRESSNISITPDGGTLFFASRNRISADLIRFRID